jgi:hypothetical protein
MLTDTSKSQIDSVKARLAADLKASGSDVKMAGVLACLDISKPITDPKAGMAKGHLRRVLFVWREIGLPTCNKGKGQNERGEFMYSLGQMSFDMFKPTNLVGEFHTGPVACWISDQPWGQV